MYDMVDPKMLNNLGYLEIKWPEIVQGHYATHPYGQ